MDAAEWAEEMVVVKASSLPPLMEGMMSSSSSTTIIPPQTMERRTRIPHKEQKQSFNCPRCKSPNTKFCYYNNYSLTQPRYFCKSCRRYWTEGGSLRNVPVGGGSRKNKRSASSSSLASSNISSSSLHPPSINADPPNATKLSSDLSLAFPASSSSLHNPDLANTGDYHHHHQQQQQHQHPYMAIHDMNVCNSTSNGRNRITNMNTFNSMPMLHGNSSAVGYPTAAPASGFGLQASFTPESTTLTFPTVDGGDINGASVFPFEDLRMQASSINPNNQFDENGGKAGRGGGGGEHSSGFWNGVIGNGAPTW